MSIIRICFFVTLITSVLFVRTLSAQFIGGNGTADDPFLISTPDQLANLSNFTGEAHYGTHFKIINDINLDVSPYNQGTGWLPIGTADNDRFGGHLDGDGHVIDGLYINRPTTNNQGLFGFLFDAVIENIGLTNVQITGNWYVGALMAVNYFSTTHNCYSTGEVNGNWFVGGLAGTHTTGPPPNGFGDSKISNSWSSCNVTGIGKAAGGFVGSINKNAEVENCFATGNVNGNEHVGGFAGQIQSAFVTNCYSTGEVTGILEVGGMFGLEPPPVPPDQPTVYTASYWNVETSGQTTSVGGEGRTTAEMTWPHTANTYVDWDFEEIWAEDQSYTVNDGYPYLQDDGATTGGESCENPYWITLPLVDFSGDTEPMGDNYSSNMISPPSTYINGNDMVFKFSLSQSGLLFGSMVASDSFIGVFIMKDCPDPVQPALLTGWATSYINTLTIPSANPNQPQEILLLPGDYFLIVSSYPPPQTIAFTLNLWIEPLSDCPQPILPYVTDISTSFASLGWTETGTAVQWDILYDEKGFDPQTGGILIEGIAQNPYTVLDLSPNTPYDFYVRSVCNENLVSDWTGPQTFTTECDFAFSAAFSEGFESENAPPECWQMWYERINPPSGNLMIHSSEDSYSGQRSFRFSSWVSGPPYDQYLRTPQLNFQDSIHVVFKYKVWLGFPVTFSVGSSVNGNDWLWGPDVNESTGIWKEYAAVFPSQTKYVAIHYKGTYMKYLFIDDFSVQPLLYPVATINPGEFNFVFTPGNIETDHLEITNQGQAELIFNAFVQQLSEPENSNLIPVYGMEFNNSENRTINDRLDEIVEFDFHSNRDVVLHYDGDNWGSIGLQNGGTILVAAMFPAELTSQYMGYQMKFVDLYLSDGISATKIMIWGEGTNSGPGTLLLEQNFAPEQFSWNTIELTDPLTLDGQDIWVGYSVTHSAGAWPVGIDIGPAALNGDWIFINNTWQKLSQISTFDANFNIRAILSQGEFWLTISPDQGAVAPGESETMIITVDASGLAPGTYYANIVVCSNDPVNPEIIVPVTLDIITSIDKTEKQPVLIYPVPTGDFVNINAGSDISSIRIFNSIGRLVANYQEINHQSVQLTVSHLKPGSYTLKTLFKDGKSLTKNIIIY